MPLRLPHLVVIAAALSGCGQPRCDPHPGWRPDMQQCNATENRMRNQHAIQRLARLQRAKSLPFPAPLVPIVQQPNAAVPTPQQRLNRYYAALQELRTPDHAARVRIGALLKRAWSKHA